MEEYYFLFALAFIWTAIAVFVDLKKREVPNWLNFSLIAFALAYRAFYSIHVNDYSFFFFGAVGFCVFFALAYGFYYARAFAGGDAKLLMGFGVILPYSNFSDLFYYGLVFLFGLFFLGVIYSLIYSVFIVLKRKEKFIKEFSGNLKRNYKLAGIFLALTVLADLLFSRGVISMFYLSIALLYFYVKSLDKCMIVKLPASKLSEGDWLDKEVRVGNKMIGRSVHGLSIKDIAILKKNDKEVYIKEGIPFTPAFLLSLIMVFFFLILEVDVLRLFSFLG